MDPIIAKLNTIKWEYADKDLNAISELKNRIEETGRKFGLISYTDLLLYRVISPFYMFHLSFPSQKCKNDVYGEATNYVMILN